MNRERKAVLDGNCYSGPALSGQKCELEGVAILPKAGVHERRGSNGRRAMGLRTNHVFSRLEIRELEAAIRRTKHLLPQAVRRDRNQCPYRRTVLVAHRA